LSRTVRPRIIIVTRERKNATNNILEEKNLLFDLRAETDIFYEIFADIRFCRLFSAELSPNTRFLLLNTEITRQLHNICFVCLQKYVLFSAIYLSNIFTLAIQSFCASLLTKFDFIAATRQTNPLNSLFGLYLKEFFLLAGRSRIFYKGISAQIVSALFIDIYLSGIHC